MASSQLNSDNFMGGIVSSSFIPQDVGSPFAIGEDPSEDPDSQKAADKLSSFLLSGKPAVSSGWGAGAPGNQTDEDKLIHLTCTDEGKSTNINKTEEYNSGYSGLSILPWEEFVFNPRALNDLFYAESNRKITYDPDEVNVFFHGRNVMPPTIGDISENGKCWNIMVENITQLRKVRTLLCEKSSVFGVTLNYKPKRFAKPERAPCLVMLDPSKGTTGDRLYTALTKAMDAIHSGRRFCVEINLNGCVERWCRSVLLTECEVEGARMVVTNGEEYETMGRAEKIVCCLFCFPVWALQTCIYKIHRTVAYDDFTISFDAEDMFLHGAVADLTCQRDFIFKAITDQDQDHVFRTRCAEQTDEKTLQTLGSYKFVCVKKVEKMDDEEETIKEHTTTSFGDLVNKRKEKVLAKDAKKRSTGIVKNTSMTFDEAKSKESSSGDINDDTRGKLKGATSSKDGVVNKAFAHDDKPKEVEDVTVSPRIPELKSVVGQQGDDVNLDVIDESKEALSDSITSVSETDSAIFEMSKSVSAVRKNISSKSLTAVCSFEINDYDLADDESSDDDEVQTKPSLLNNTESKENLFDELAKINKTLPTAKQVPLASSEIDHSEHKDEHGDSKKNKDRKKHKVGKVLKDLTKTTKAAKMSLPSEEDTKYKEAREKLKHSKLKTSLRENQEQTRDTEDNKTGSFNTKGSASKGKQVNKDPGNSQAENISEFTFDASSTDGEDVEMIDQAGAKDRSVNKTARRENPIGQVAKVNGLRVTNKETCNDTDEAKTAGLANTTVEDNWDDSESDEDRNNDSSKTTIKSLSMPNAILPDNPRPKFMAVHAKSLEDDMDVTDMDEFDGNVNREQKVAGTTAVVPPLRLNVGEQLGKKAKRPSRNFSSNRKYLGTAVPPRLKKH